MEVYIHSRPRRETLASTPPPQTGRLIAGKYLLEAELGRGGMGAVYAARHLATGRRFAVKVLSAELAGDPEAEARFLREAMLASAINHPAIVEVYDVGRDADAPYMVMKLLQGETLGARLKRGPLSPDEAVALLLPVLHGVEAAHARGVLHRDLKPDNILLAREGGVSLPKVLDFGISKLLTSDARTRLTRTGVTIGTPLYMSPEQVRGEDDIDARADVYSLGVILYETLTGALPYEGNNYADLVLRIITGNAKSIREHDPSLPASLEAVVARAMAPLRAERYASASALASDLARFKHLPASSIAPRASHRPSSRASSTPFVSEAAARTQSAPSSRTGLFVLAALGVLVAGAALLWLAWPAPSQVAPQRTAAAAANTAAPAAARPATAVAAPQATPKLEPVVIAPAAAAPPSAVPSSGAAPEPAPAPSVVAKPPAPAAAPRERVRNRVAVAHKPEPPPEPEAEVEADSQGPDVASEIIDPFQ